jgi:hypothetical protein
VINGMGVIFPDFNFQDDCPAEIYGRGMAVCFMISFANMYF